MARLLNDVQAGQNTMAAILHQLAPGQDAIDREALLRELEAADRGLVKIASLATGTPEVERWQELSQAAREFSAGVRQSVQHGRTLRPADLVPLFSQHDQVMRLQQKLLETSESQMRTIEQRLAAESRELATNSRFLLGACLVLALLCAVLKLGLPAPAFVRLNGRPAN